MLTSIQWSFEPSQWPWPWAQQSDLLTRHSNLWWWTFISSLVLKEPQFRRCSTNSHILFISKPTVTLTLKLTNQSFRMTLRVIIMHHYAKFDCKWFSGSEDIVRTNIHENFKPSMWHWPLTQQSNISQDTLASDDTATYQVCLQKDLHFRKYSRSNDELSPPIFSHVTHRHTKFGHKRLSGSEDSDKTWTHRHRQVTPI